MKKKLLTTILFIPYLLPAQVKEVSRFQNDHARQAVVVDEAFIYVIDNAAIAKLRKQNFEPVASWQDITGTIPHLNSAIIIDDTLYCATSNYPEVPMTSSIEMFTTNPLKHVGNHSFGIFRGSCTWVLRHKGSWWAFFAHYENRAQSENKGVEWSSLVRFDDQWREVASWTIPDEILDKLRPYSLSGGIFINDNQLLTTGHHEPFVYLLELPRSGSGLRFVKEIEVPIKGQGIAYDPWSESFWGIIKSGREVIQFKLLWE